MSAALYSDAGAYFVRLSGGTVLGWRRDQEGWTPSRTDLPATAGQIGFEALPEELREEVLAVLVRDEAVQGPLEGMNN